VLSSRNLLLLVLVLSTAMWSQATARPADLAEVSINGSTVDLRAADGALVRLLFLDENILRIQATTGEEPVGENSGRAPIVLAAEPAGVNLRHDDRGDFHSFSTSTIELIVHRSPLTMELRRLSDGTTLWRELKPLTIGDSTTTQTLDSGPGERFYGGGQQNGAFQFKGRLMEISYSGGWEEGDRPSPAPFYMSDRGYGVLRNTWADGVYDFRSDHYLTTTHNEDRFDAWFIVGESIHDVLDLYTSLTGRARLLPRWAFEYGDADCYNDGDNVKKPGTVPDGWSDGPTGTTPDVVTSVAEKYREHDMPGGWILPNDGYGCGYTDLPGVVERLGELGFHTGLWTENGVEKIAWEVGTAGTRVQKLDVAWTGKGYQWALDANHDAAQGFLDNSDARPFIWTVMGWAGIQRYAVTWTGDQSGSWDYIRWHVPTLIGSGLSGMNYSTGDVDGIFGGSPETFTRDLQWKAFTTVFMGMSGWSKAERKHPWWFDEPYRSINRRYLKLRQRLMPYIYTLARETESAGAPMVRGLMWDYPGDPNIGNYPYQFFLGRDLLVAPVYRSEKASGGWREGVYLPAGRWIDYWSGIVVDTGGDGRVVDIPVDLATLPVLVRAGAIIPMYPESLYDGQVPADPLTLDIYPHGHSEFVLYEDDGNTRAYRDGALTLQRFVVSQQDNRNEIQIDAAEGEFEGRLDRRAFVLQVHSRRQPLDISVNGEAVRHVPESAAFEAAGRGWRYDPEDRFGVVYVKTGPVDTRAAHRVILTFAPDTRPAVTGQYPPGPAGDGTVSPDALMVVSRTAEEPGHPLENAFDGNPDTWFRTVRDQRVAYGPHEFTLSLGGRRVIEGFRIRPRNDKYWKYGQVRNYELYMADVNGRWGEPVAAGTLEQTDSLQEVRFTPKAGRLLRFRVLSTHDDERDPMVTGAVGSGAGSYDALAPVRVGPTTISEFRLLERSVSPGREIIADLAEVAGRKQTPVVMNGLEFPRVLRATGGSRIDFELKGDWHTFRTEAGIDDESGDTGTARFQVWGDGQLLWDSGAVRDSQIVKPKLDIRGITSLSLRTRTTADTMKVNWAETAVAGFEGDTVRLLKSPKGR
jgi:alpha-glucosidase (family GH31 glycosyl hydrolase)